MAQIFYTAVPGSPSGQQSFEVDLDQFLQSAVVLNTEVPENSVVVDEGDLFQCGKCRKHFKFTEFVAHKRTLCQGIQFNLTLPESDGMLSQPMEIVQEDLESNNNNSDEIITMSNNAGEIFSFRTAEKVPTDILEPLQTLEEFGDQTFDNSNLDISNIKTSLRIGGNNTLEINPIINDHYLISHGHKGANEMLLTQESIEKISLSLMSTGEIEHENKYSEGEEVTNHKQSLQDLSILDSENSEENSISKFKKEVEDMRDQEENSLSEEHYELTFFFQKCDYCGKSFRKKFDLQQHLRCHTGERPFQCIVCGRAFAQKSNVIKHIATHKVWPKKNATLPSAEKGLMLAGKSFVCQYCPLIFENWLDWKHHRASHAEQKVYMCVQKSCPLTFKQLDAFLEHSQNHTEKTASYECHICHKEFKSLDELGQHQIFHEAVKSAPKLVSCQICRAKFTSNESLEKHLATDSHSYPCPSCERVFACERFLRRHLSIHSPVLKFTCEICCKAFRTEQNLNAHKVTHTDFKPFTCQVCRASFNRRDKLVRHNLTHENAKRYKCPFKVNCDKSFNRKDKLNQHILTHNSWKYVCRYCQKGFSTATLVDSHEFICTKGRSNIPKRNKKNEKKVSTIEIVVFPASNGLDSKAHLSQNETDTLASSNETDPVNLSSLQPPQPKTKKKLKG